MACVMYYMTPVGNCLSTSMSGRPVSVCNASYVYAVAWLPWCPHLVKHYTLRSLHSCGPLPASRFRSTGSFDWIASPFTYNWNLAVAVPSGYV